MEKCMTTYSHTGLRKTVISKQKQIVKQCSMSCIKLHIITTALSLAIKCFHKSLTLTYPAYTGYRGDIQISDNTPCYTIDN